MNEYIIGKIICTETNCWMTTDKGVLYFGSLSADNIHPVCQKFDEPVSDITKDARGGILVVHAYGIERMKEGRVVEKLISNQSSLGRFPLTTAFVDRDKNFWLGSLKGLLRLNDLNTKFFPVKRTGAPDQSIRSLCEVGKTLWMGTFDGLIRKENTHFTYINKARGRSIDYVLF